MPLSTNEKPRTKTVRRVKRRVVVKKKKFVPVAPPKRTPEQKKAIRERQETALDLRMAGSTYREIAQALNYKSPSAAKNAVDSALSRVQIDAAKEVVSMDLARLDEFQMRCMYALRNNGDLGQIDRIMRIMEWRYRLLGINDETVRQLQSEHGIHTTNRTTNNVQVIMARPDTEKDFIEKMMNAVGVDPDSDEAQTLLRQYNLNDEADRTLPMLEGSANSDKDAIKESAKELEGEDIVDAEIVD